MKTLIRSRSTLLGVGIVPLALLLGGCGDGMSFDMGGGGLFDGGRSKPGTEWTILCQELRGPDARSRSDQLAEALRRTPGVKAEKVYVRHDEDRSRVYYGKYWHPVDRRTGVSDVPAATARDAKMIKQLAVNGQLYFIDSRLIPAPLDDVGNPAWHLRNNPGVNTLRVGIFHPEPEFGDWKKAAADFCAELRAKGHEAYYRHGDFTSEVYVGSLGADALVNVRRSGVLASVPGPKVQQMQRDPLLRYELDNRKQVTVREGRKKLARASKVVPVHSEWDEEYTGF